MYVQTEFPSFPADYRPSSTPGLTWTSREARQRIHLMSQDWNAEQMTTESLRLLCSSHSHRTHFEGYENVFLWGFFWCFCGFIDRIPAVVEVVVNSFKAYCLWTGHTLRFNGAKAWKQLLNVHTLTGRMSGFIYETLLCQKSIENLHHGPADLCRPPRPYERKTNFLDF